MIFGWPWYRGKAIKSNAPPRYYDLRKAANQMIHWNGYYQMTYLIQSGAWDALVARITHDDAFPPPTDAAGETLFPRPAHPNPWNPQENMAMCNFIRDLQKVSLHTPLTQL
jgi:hypothetical protein